MPTYEDAKLLLELDERQRTDAFVKARQWWFLALPEEPPMEFEEFEKKNAQGSKGETNLWYVASFWETAGVLVRRKLLSEDLFFDRFSMLPYWERAKRIIRGYQRKYNPRLAENFEWLAKRESRGTQRAAKKKRR